MTNTTNTKTDNHAQIKPEDKVMKGDAGTAATPQPLKPPLESSSEAQDSKIGTPEDTAGRTIPMGEPMEDSRVQALASFFDVPSEDLQNVSKSLAEIVNLVIDLEGITGIPELLEEVRATEDKITKPHSSGRRWSHLLNYLKLKSEEGHIKKILKAWELKPEVKAE